MKNIFYSLALLFVLLASSCSQEWAESDVALGHEAETITLTLRSVDAMTRATMPGEDIYNENLIKSVHYFFYPKDGTDANTEKEPAKMGQAKNLSKLNEHTLTISASENEIKNVLFKYPYNDCDVYVIVNLPSDINLDALPDHKLSTLKKIVLKASFDATITQQTFVMDGMDVATVIDRNKVLAARGTVPVDRVASKISVSVSVDDRLDLQTPPDTPDNTTSGMIWTSNPEQMKIELVNGVNRTVLSGNPDDVTLLDTDKFTVMHPVSNIKNGESRPEYARCEPFYTYPTKWEIGSDEEPYIFITLPWTTIIWTSVGGQEPPIYKTYPCYYKIMLGSDELKRNTWYDLKINIGMLGSFENTPEVILPVESTEYFVADWSTGLSVESEILGARYLAVDKEYFELYDDMISIPFTSSHECEIVDMTLNSSTGLNKGTITYPDYSKDTPNENSTLSWNSSTWSLFISGQSINFSHILRNDLSAGKGNYEYAPYTVKFRIRHKDEPNAFYKDITIKQSPAMLIECFPNRKLNTNGGVIVNGGTSNYGGVHGLTGNNKNPNMYVITTTILPDNSSLILGDPRSSSVNTLGVTWTNAKGIENITGNNRRLSKYYPTDESATAANIIAPKFRIASSYGVTNAITYANAKNRCASYQEDGYPAGRWRLPTKAEISYIVQLSADNVIPTLFTEGSAYWCSGGQATPLEGGGVTLNNTTSGSTYVRCVYDEWYWEMSEYPRIPATNSTTFIWGDEI